MDVVPTQALGKPLCFVVRNGSAYLYMQATDERSRQDWISAIKLAIEAAEVAGLSDAVSACGERTTVSDCTHRDPRVHAERNRMLPCSEVSLRTSGHHSAQRVSLFIHFTMCPRAPLCRAMLGFLTRACSRDRHTHTHTGGVLVVRIGQHARRRRNQLLHHGSRICR